jgi:hypothetical protein
LEAQPCKPAVAPVQIHVFLHLAFGYDGDATVCAVRAPEVLFNHRGRVDAGGTGIGVRFLFYYFTDGGTGKIQSLILAAILLIIGFNVLVIGLLSNNLATNRRLLEDCLVRVRSIELERKNHGEPSHKPKKAEEDHEEDHSEKQSPT